MNTVINKNEITKKDFEVFCKNNYMETFKEEEVIKPAIKDFENLIEKSLKTKLSFEEENDLNMAKIELSSLSKAIVVNDDLSKEAIYYRPLDYMEKAQGHKYFKREGARGHYKYYYTEAQYKEAKGIKEDGKKKVGKEDDSSIIKVGDHTFKLSKDNENFTFTDGKGAVYNSKPNESKEEFIKRAKKDIELDFKGDNKKQVNKEYDYKIDWKEGKGSDNSDIEQFKTKLKDGTNIEVEYYPEEEDQSEEGVVAYFDGKVYGHDGSIAVNQYEIEDAVRKSKDKKEFISNLGKIGVTFTENM